jgi:hypothetical protein
MSACSAASINGNIGKKCPNNGVLVNNRGMAIPP